MAEAQHRPGAMTEAVALNKDATNPSIKLADEEKKLGPLISLL